MAVSEKVILDSAGLTDIAVLHRDRSSSFDFSELRPIFFLY
jgi:hypothetical protein